jgi:hypothetical protein
VPNSRGLQSARKLTTHKLSHATILRNHPLDSRKTLNFLTGSIFLLISLKARHLAPHILILIPAIYLLGWVGIRTGGVHAEAAFNGRYLMFAYFAICLGTYAYFLIMRRRSSRSHP